MSVKGSDILNKLIAAGLLIASMAFFVGMGHTDEFVIPGLLFGAGGFWLASRRGRPAVERDPALDRRLTELAEGLAVTQAELANMSERLERYAEEREFMRELAASRTARATAVPARPLEMPAFPDAPEIPPPR